VLVSIDTLRADHVGLYGYERDTTPFLDRFGARGIVYENVITSAAWTLIAHMTMLTGLFPDQHNVTEGKRTLAAEAPLLAERLKQRGYHTVGLYRPGWIHPRHGFERGFDVFRQHHPVEEAEVHLEEELAKLPPGEPFFLFLHLFDVHNDPSTKDPPSVYSAPEPYQDLFLPGARERLAGQTYASLKKRPIHPEEREALAALYDDGIRHVDAALERIFGKLEADGRLADTLVIVTSDHGESLAQRGPMTGHGGPWQEGVHVPLIVRLPGDARAGTRVAELAHLVDVVPTVLDFLGLPADPLLPGHSLLQPLPPRRVVSGGNDPVQYALQWPEKLMRSGTSVGRVDLEHDPGELDIRIVENADFERLKELRGLAPGSIYPAQKIGAMSREDRDDLEALGYGGGHDEEDD